MDLKNEKHARNSKFILGPGPPSPPFGSGIVAGWSLGLGVAQCSRQFEASFHKIKSNIFMAQEFRRHRWGPARLVNFWILRRFHYIKVAFRIYKTCEKSRTSQMVWGHKVVPSSRINTYIHIYFREAAELRDTVREVPTLSLRIDFNMQ